MLSPEKLKPGTEAVEEFFPLHQYDCMVNLRPFQDAPDNVAVRLRTSPIESAGADESVYYRGLAKFLTECIEICRSSLDNQHGILSRQGWWFKNLEFTIGELVVDGGDGATPGIRTLRFAVFGGEDKPLIEAKNPHQLSRSSAHFLLGAFVNILWYLHRTDLPISQDGC